MNQGTLVGLSPESPRPRAPEAASVDFALDVATDTKVPLTKRMNRTHGVTGRSRRLSALAA